MDAVVIGDQFLPARLIDDLDAVIGGGLEQPLDEPRPAAPRLEREPAPEHELALVLERLARVHRREADALGAHPQQGLLAARDQQLGQVGVRLVVGQAAEIVVVLVLRIGAEIAGRQFLLAEIAKLQQVLDAVVDKAQRPGGVAAVAAALLERRRLEDEDARPFLLRRQGCAQPGIARPDDDDVKFARDHLVPPPRSSGNE